MNTFRKIKSFFRKKFETNENCYYKVKNDKELYEDIKDYTHLSDHELKQVLSRKKQNFVKEWNKREVKDDYWYYLSSTGYFWANLSHLNGDYYMKILSEFISNKKGTVLEYGGGVGNITYTLARNGYKAEHLELSVLQKDFLQFRVDKHKLPVKILNVWSTFNLNHYDAILALDVFEHIKNADEILMNKLAPSLKNEGIIIDFTCYGKTINDPMHLENVYEKKLMEAFDRAKLKIIHNDNDYRVWKK